jgi:HD-GYP domain-containing protein (c-di-GMP phosphodiesterase class II)
MRFIGRLRSRDTAEADTRALLQGADALVQTLSARDPATGEHLNRVACIATEIGLIEGLDEAALLPVEVGARLHDIGKLGVADVILQKPGPLTNEEWEVMRRHPLIGATLLASVPGLAHLATVVRAHHERWDGTGYPDGLRGEAIPFESRIFALADSIEAMTADRPYAPAKDWDYVRSELVSGGGTQWDPSLAARTLVHLDRLQRLALGCPHGAG